MLPVSESAAELTGPTAPAANSAGRATLACTGIATGHATNSAGPTAATVSVPLHPLTHLEVNEISHLSWEVVEAARESLVTG